MGIIKYMIVIGGILAIAGNWIGGYSLSLIGGCLALVGGLLK